MNGIFSPPFYLQNELSEPGCYFLRNPLGKGFPRSLSGILNRLFACLLIKPQGIMTKEFYFK